MTWADTALLEVVEHVKNCVCGALIDTAGRVEGQPGCPCRTCAVPGTMPGQQAECCDNCGSEEGGSLQVNVNRVYPSEAFPTQSAAVDCRTLAMAADLTVRLIRCIPVFAPDGQGPPSCETLQRAADVSNVDAISLYRAAACCVPDRPGRRRATKVVNQGLTSVSDGMCAGWDLRLTVNLGACDCEVAS